MLCDISAKHMILSQITSVNRTIPACILNIFVKSAVIFDQFNAEKMIHFFLNIAHNLAVMNKTRLLLLLLLTTSTTTIELKITFITVNKTNNKHKIHIN